MSGTIELKTERLLLRRHEDAYYEWQDRINVLQDLIDVIDMRME